MKPKIITFLQKHGAALVLAGLLSVFLAYSVFVAVSVQRVIIPDEPAHMAFSQQYAATLGIPADNPQTYIHGWYIQQNPFLYYWLNGRALNALALVAPSASEWMQLVFLRLLSVLYSLGTVFFCFLLSREVIRHKWWQLLPVFLLTNTLMFVFLSGGVNYDNLANLFSMASLYYLARVFNRKDFIPNSLGFLLSICLGALVKYPILPLALAEGVAWLAFSLLNRKSVFPLRLRGARQITAGVFLLAAVAGNLAIYGVNLVRYQSITPDCSDLLTPEQCAVSPFVQRAKEIGLERKLTIQESIELGYPNPVEYAVDAWFPYMLYRIYGILGHQSYFPAHIIVFYRLLFLWILLLAFRYVRQPSFLVWSLAGIFIFYALVLLYINYGSELAFGFKNIAMQGRYLFPVIGAGYVLMSLALSKVSNRVIAGLSLLATLLLFLVGGPLKFITHASTIFKGWFITY